MACAAPSNINNHEELGELTALNILEFLSKKPNFIVSAHWTLLLRLLEVSINDVNILVKAAKIDPNNVQHHLEDGLGIWLNQDESRSWQKIDDAVNYIMENEKATVVFTVFWPAIESILKELEENIVQLVMDKLEAEEIIPSNRNSNISIKQLFGMLHEFVEASPNQNLQRLYNVLTKSREFKCFKELTSCFKVECELCELDLIFDPSSPTEVPFSPIGRSEIDVLIETYNNLVVDVIEDFSERLHNSVINDQRLRNRLMNSSHFQEDPPDENDATIKLLPVYIKHMSSVMTTDLLKCLCDKFGSSEIQNEIEKYETKRQKLCEALTADELISRPLENVKKNGLNTIKFTVDKNVRETKIAQIQDLLRLAFKNSGVFIHVSRVKEGNSFTVTCYAPESMIGLLIYKAQKNLSLLKEKGIIFLRIGYCTLLDHKREYEINTEFFHDDLKNEIKELTTRNENLQSEAKKLRMMLEDNGIDLQTFVKADTGKVDESVDESVDYKAKLKQQEMEVLDTRGKQIEFDVSPVEVEVLIEKQTKMTDTISQLVPRKKVDSDDDSLPLEPVKMKQPLEVDKSQETVIKEDLLETDKQSQYKEKGESNMKEKMMRGYLNEIEQLRAQLKGEKMMSEKYLKMKDEKDSLESTLKEMKKSSTQQESDMQLKKSVLERRIPTLHDGGREQYPPVEILMTQYSKRKSMYEHWYSPSFYTHPGGYKLCVKMVPSGQDKGEGTHLSLYVHVMSGDYDDRLPWPFMGVVKLQLRNRRGDHGHLESTVVYNESTKLIASGRVESGPRTPSGTAAHIGKGYAQWIRNEDLQYQAQADTLYLKDDVLIVRVTEVAVDKTRIPPVVTPPITIEGGAAASQYIAEFRVPNFDTLKKNSKSWESEGFYTGPNESGYKFLLAVHPNGKDQYKGERVSVYTHLMKGKNDDHLRFPFRGAITVELVNQRDNKNHVAHTIRYTKEDDSFGWRGGRIRAVSFSNKLAGRSYGGWGYAGFVKHEYLPYNRANNTQYLTDNNELVFRITKVELFY